MTDKIAVDGQLHADLDALLSIVTMHVNDVNRANGWHDDKRTVGDGIALLHSEVSEMFEAYRDGGLGDQTAYTYTEDGALTQESTPEFPRGVPVKPEGYGSECADVLIRLLDECSRHGIDLATEFVRKVNYNATRGYKHGGKAI